MFPILRPGRSSAGGVGLWNTACFGSPTLGFAQGGASVCFSSLWFLTQVCEDLRRSQCSIFFCLACLLHNIYKSSKIWQSLNGCLGKRLSYSFVCFKNYLLQSNCRALMVRLHRQAYASSGSTSHISLSLSMSPDCSSDQCTCTLFGVINGNLWVTFLSFGQQEWFSGWFSGDRVSRSSWRHIYNDEEWTEQARVCCHFIILKGS